MSRCFPYPPPGYTLSRSKEDALIESIKLQKERKTKEQRKEKRKEKKERRKEKDSGRKERKVKANQNSDKYDLSKGQYGKSFCASVDHLEKSGLTEENEQPIWLHIPSTSSDSTENSTKRKRDLCPLEGRRGHGNIIRIRTTSKKQIFSNLSIDEHLCSTSGRTDIHSQDRENKQKTICIPAQNKASKQNPIYIPTEETSKSGQGFTARAEKEHICLISKNDAGAPGMTGTPSLPDAVRSSIQKRELKYKKLIKTCLPPQLEYTRLEKDDLDWLFSGNNQSNPAEKRLKSECGGMSCSSSSTLWQPHACFLPEVDVHALPFTVPFA